MEVRNNYSYETSKEKIKEYNNFIAFIITHMLMDDKLNFYGNAANFLKILYLSTDHDYDFFDIDLRLENKNIYLVINPKTFFKYPQSEMIFKMIHVIEHIFRFHLEIPRSGYNKKVTQPDGRIIKLSDIATDLEVNSLAFKKVHYTGKYSKDTDFLLTQSIFPTEGAFEKFPVEATWFQHYSELEKMVSNGEEIPLPGNYYGNNWENDYSFEADDLKREINNLIDYAVGASKDTPFRYKDYVKNIKKVKRDWKQDLSIFLATSLAKDAQRTKRKANRKALAIDKVAPGKKKRYEKSVAAFVDTSGSYTDDFFETAVSHMYNICGMFDSKLWVGAFDTEVHTFSEVNKFNYKDFLKTKLPHTRGGTTFGPIFKKIEDEKLSPDVIIIFTDGYNSDPLPKCPLGHGNNVLWVYTEIYQKQSFGHHLMM